MITIAQPCYSLHPARCAPVQKKRVSCSPCSDGLALHTSRSTAPGKLVPSLSMRRWSARLLAMASMRVRPLGVDSCKAAPIRVAMLAAVYRSITRWGNAGSKPVHSMSFDVRKGRVASSRAGLNSCAGKCARRPPAGRDCTVRQTGAEKRFASNRLAQPDWEQRIAMRCFHAGPQPVEPTWDEPGRRLFQSIAKIAMAS